MCTCVSIFSWFFIFSSSDGMKTPGFATSPLPATSTHMPSCDGVVVGMLTSSPQEEGTCGCGLLNGKNIWDSVQQNRACGVIILSL